MLTSKTLGPLLVLFTVILDAHAYGRMQDWAEAKYNALPGPELQVRQTQDGGPILGIGIMQKNDQDGGFCRKITVVAPGAQPRYECYAAELTGQDAQDAYEASNSEETQVTFFMGDHPLIGSRWMERPTTAARFGSDLLCVKTEAVVPHPVPNFVCYTTRPPLGGGVSVGN